MCNDDVIEFSIHQNSLLLESLKSVLNYLLKLFHQILHLPLHSIFMSLKTLTFHVIARNFEIQKPII